MILLRSREYNISIRTQEAINERRIFFIILLLVFFTSSKVVHEGLTKFEESNLFVVGNSKGHIVTIALTIEPFDARYVRRDLICSNVVEIWCESHYFCHILEAGEFDLLFARRG